MHPKHCRQSGALLGGEPRSHTAKSDSRSPKDNPDAKSQTWRALWLQHDTILHRHSGRSEQGED